MSLLARTCFCCLSRPVSPSISGFLPFALAGSAFRSPPVLKSSLPSSSSSSSKSLSFSSTTSMGDSPSSDSQQIGNGGGCGGVVRPRIPVSSITSFGEGLGKGELQSLSAELEAASEGDKLAFPFVSKVYDVSNAALFYAHNGRLGTAQAKLKAGAELVAAELTSVDEAGSRDGVRQERVSNGLENLVKANAFVHFLQTGRLLRKAEMGAEFKDGEYLGAVMRLTSELARYAITQASVLDQSSIRSCAALCHALFEQLMQFDLRNGPLRKKFDGVKYDVRKIDDILYELSLVGERGSEGVGGSDEGAGGESRKRGREEVDEDEDAGMGVDGDGGVLDKNEFAMIREVMTAFDEKRESVIKQTRDVQKWSKMAIYSLHRGDFKKAEKQLSDCRKAADALLPLITETPRLRIGSFSCAMEEFAEARLYQLWLKDKRLATMAEVGLVNTEEYLGGVLDLTGELNRFAVARATERDSAGVKECLETVLVIHEFVTLNSLPGKLPKKMNELNNSLRKLQNMTYELALTKAGKGKVAGVSGLAEGSGAVAKGKDEEE